MGLGDVEREGFVGCFFDFPILKGMGDVFIEFLFAVSWEMCL